MSLESVITDWDELSKEFSNLEVSENENKFQMNFNEQFNKKYTFRFHSKQEVSNEYGELLEKLVQLQQKCTKDISHQRYRISQISNNLKK